MKQAFKCQRIARIRERGPCVLKAFIGASPRCAIILFYAIILHQMDSSLNIYPKRQNPVKPFCVAMSYRAKAVFVGESSADFFQNGTSNFLHPLHNNFRFVHKKTLYNFRVTRANEVATAGCPA